MLPFLFLLAICIRFLYFPDNVYFSFDQARDSYTALDLVKGDLKIVGPPSSAGEKLFAGPLVYYIYAPIYYLFDKNPEILSLFLRVFNATGIFLASAISTILFNKSVGFLVSLFYAFSYEQTQYSLFISHQPQAVIPVLFFYLGLGLTIFKNKSWGIILAAAGAGLAIQFHYLYVYLAAVLVISLLFFGKTKSLKLTLKLKETLFAVLAFLLIISPYIISEFKFDFRVLTSFVGSTKSITSIHLKESIFIFERFISDNFLSNSKLIPFLGVALLAIAGYFYSKKETRKQIIFLALWFFSSLTPYLLSGTPSYYYGAGANIALLIFASFVIFLVFKKFPAVSFLLTIALLINNLSLIQEINPQGLNKYMIIQPGMLTRDQKKILDYIYKESKSEKFAVKALTIPLDVNTTWSYIFQWYGQQKYGVLPTWVGPIADGYTGLKAQDDRSKLPKTQFLIIEPTIGIREGTIKEFFKEESYFTRVVDEKQFGTLRVQKRERI